MLTSLVAKTKEFTEHSVSKFFDCKIPEEEMFWPITDSYFSFSNMVGSSIAHLVQVESKSTDYKIYTKIYWIDEKKQILTISREIYSFSLFADYNSFSVFVSNLYEKYAILSEEAIFYIIIHRRIVASNCLTLYFQGKLNNPRYQKDVTDYIIKNFENYINIPF